MVRIGKKKSECAHPKLTPCLHQLGESFTPTRCLSGRKRILNNTYRPGGRKQVPNHIAPRGAKVADTITPPHPPLFLRVRTMHYNVLRKCTESF